MPIVGRADHQPPTGMDSQKKTEMINDLCRYRPGEDGDQRWLRLAACVIGTYDLAIQAEQRITALEHETEQLRALIAAER
jgi:hypothetical protein